MKKQFGWITFIKWFITLIIWFAVFAFVGIDEQNKNGITPENTQIAMGVSVLVAVVAFFLLEMFFTLLFSKYRQYKKERKDWKNAEKDRRRSAFYAKNQPDSEIAKIEMLGTNQAFDTSLLSGITYNQTEYTVKITFHSGDSTVRKVKGAWLARYSDYIVTH